MYAPQLGLRCSRGCPPGAAAGRGAAARGPEAEPLPRWFAAPLWPCASACRTGDSQAMRAAASSARRACTRGACDGWCLRSACGCLGRHSGAPTVVLPACASCRREGEPGTGLLWGCFGACWLAVGLLQRVSLGKQPGARRRSPALRSCEPACRTSCDDPSKGVSRRRRDGPANHLCAWHRHWVRGAHARACAHVMVWRAARASPRFSCTAGALSAASVAVFQGTPCSASGPEASAPLTGAAFHAGRTPRRSGRASTA